VRVLDHPSPETLKRWFAGQLPEDESASVERHVAAGCRGCRTRLEPALEDLLREHLGGPPPAADEDGGVYDVVADRAFSSVAPQLAAAWSERRATGRAYTALVAEGVKGLTGRDGRSFEGPELCSALLRRSHELRHRDPEQMLRLAWLAVRAARSLGEERWGTARVADFRARAWAELANAYRLRGDLGRAEEAMATSGAHFARGSRDPYLSARLKTLQATLLAGQRHFDQALEALGGAEEAYAELGELRERVRLLVKKGIYQGYAARSAEAVRTLSLAVALIDRRTDPELALEAVHSLAVFHVDAGRWRRARALLLANARLYEEHGQGVLSIKRRWLEGRISACRSELGSAAQNLTAAIGGLEEAGLGYAAAIACLDLASVWLRLDKPRAAALLVEGAADFFLALGIGREALAAIAILREALRREDLSAGLVHEAIRSLRRLVNDPAAGLHRD
jgi:hypothetical protein